MNLHKHARLTPRGRALLVERVINHGLRVEEAATLPAWPAPHSRGAAAEVSW
ncbi:leucine zipper domain-containing protein [Pseudoxanthomonas broegbernensis]|uniref:leucine zipper domain-containing protein n=1 Tax=Pseudoxanthomonas broegbernensis TaxID=83619 RepID=UPI00182CDF16|nr:hypothetical protein [Pseudoxanthomonas broegbernensis]